MYRQLLLGLIPENFDPKFHLPIAPSCFLGRENYFEEWENIYFPPDPFKNCYEIKQAERITCDEAQYFLSFLTGHLNKINNSSYSNEFWKIIVYPWLLTLIQVCYERQQRVQYVINKHYDQSIKVQIVADDIVWNIANSRDIMTLVLDSFFNEWLFSRIIERNIPNNWDVEYVSKEPNRTQNISYSTDKRLNLKTIAAIVKLYISKLMLCNHVKGMPFFDQVVFHVFLNLVSLKKQITTNYKVSNAIGNKTNNFSYLPNIDWIFDFSKILYDLLPTCFQNVSTSQHAPILFSKIKVLGSQLFFWNDEQKIYYAKCYEKGDRFIATQHGGNYGNAKSFSFPAEVEYKHLAFFTWGWNRHEDYSGNFYPLSSPFISKYANSHTQKTDKIIFVTTRMNLFLYRLDSMPQPFEQIQKMKENINFFNNLTYDVFSNLYLRTYMNKQGSINDKKIICKKFPELKIVTNNLHQELLQCKLLILDHPGTTLNIALAANVPTLCFWDPSAWSMCKQALPFFEKLGDVGILWRSGEEAALQANKIHRDTNDWWNDSIIQAEKEEWVHNYARINKHWRKEWFRAIWKI